MAYVLGAHTWANPQTFADDIVVEGGATINGTLVASGGIQATGVSSSGDFSVTSPTGTLRVGTAPSSTTGMALIDQGTSWVIRGGNTNYIQFGPGSSMGWIGGRWSWSESGGIVFGANSARARIMQSQDVMRSVELIGSADGVGEIACMIGTKYSDAQNGNLATLLQLSTDTDGTPAVKHEFYGDGSAAFQGKLSLTVGTGKGVYFGDGDTGFEESSDDDLRIVVANTQALRVKPQPVLTGALKSDTGDPSSPDEGQLQINTFDNVAKIYADGAWRILASW